MSLEGWRSASLSGPRRWRGAPSHHEALIASGILASSCPPSDGCSDLLRGHLPSEEVTHQTRDLIAVRFQSEVACIQQVIFQRLQVPLEKLAWKVTFDAFELPAGEGARRPSQIEARRLA